MALTDAAADAALTLWIDALLPPIPLNAQKKTATDGLRVLVRKIYEDAAGAVVAGATGATGTAGSAGTNGATGATGTAGSAGTNGATGATGAAGTNGTIGIDGATGATGAAGSPGGATGATGAAGTNGTNGTNGATGATGAAGSNGSNGTNGTNGATGATGAAGSNGTNGTNGATGATGAAGSNGTNGTNGATGATGAAGTNGTAGVIAAFGSRPSNTNGQVFYPNDGGFQQIGDGTNWWNVVSGVPLKEPPATATIATQTNFGTSSLTKTNGLLVFSPQVATGPALRTSGKTIVTLASAVVTAGASTAAPSSNYNAWCVYMRESGTGKIYSFGGFNSLSSHTLTTEKWTSATARSSFTDYAYHKYTFPNGGFPLLLRLAISGANVLAQVSSDGGLNFSTFETVAKTTAFTTAPDEFGICCHVENNTTPGPTMSFFTLTFAGD